MPAPRLSPDVRLRLVTALAEGMSMVKACRLLLIGSTTVSNWRRADGAFSEEVSRARAAGELARAAARPAPKPKPTRTPVVHHHPPTVAPVVPLIETPAPIEAPRAAVAQPRDARTYKRAPNLSAEMAKAATKAACAAAIALLPEKDRRFDLPIEAWKAVRVAVQLVSDPAQRHALALALLLDVEQRDHAEAFGMNTHADRKAG